MTGTAPPQSSSSPSSYPSLIIIRKRSLQRTFPAGSPFEPYWSRLTLDPTTTAVVAATAGVGGTLCALAAYRRWFKRIRSSEYVTPGMLSRKRKVKGVVTRVGDGDNFRVFHTPSLYFRSIPTKASELKDQTLHIRLAGVDAPELQAAHFGKPAQPFSAEALVWLKEYVEGKKVVVELCSRDQYGRIVGNAFLPRRLFWPVRKNISLEMIKAGYGTVYTSLGAEYGGMLEQYRRAEEAAKAAKKGMWVQSAAKYESPAEYKKRMAAGGAAADPEADTAPKRRAKKKSGGSWWFGRLFGRT